MIYATLHRKSKKIGEVHRQQGDLTGLVTKVKGGIPRKADRHQWIPRQKEKDDLISLL
jgi:hypothetical protein